MQGLVKDLRDILLKNDMKLATAESCTGGLLSATIIHKPGASQVFERGFISYSNESKVESLGVRQELLFEHGAVSAQVADAMAIGAIRNSKADIALSITGVAGPDGGSGEKPVGLVHFGYALKGGASGSLGRRFDGNRQDIQIQAVEMALKYIISILGRQTYE